MISLVSRSIRPGRIMDLSFVQVIRTPPMKVTDVLVYPLVCVRRQYPTVISTQIRKEGVTPIEESYFVLFEVVADGPQGTLRGTGEVSDIPEESLPDLPRLRDELREALVGR